MKLTLGALLFLSSLSACSDSSAAARRGERGRIEDSSNGTVVLGIRAGPLYRTAVVAASGAIRGTISLQGPASDSMIKVMRDPKVCGDSAAVSEIRSNGSVLGNALVWVEGVALGKPLVEDRRGMLTIERCSFDPRVLAVSSGTTFNVFSRDHAVHDMHFYREGAREPIEHIHTVDAGQVVPSEKIASAPGIVEVRCSEHPWARGYIAVFDHPYFAVTADDGTFTIDGLPSGTYTVKVWHERLGKPLEQRVVVEAGGTGRLDVSLALR